MATTTLRQLVRPPYRYVRYELLPSIGHLLMSRRNPRRLVSRWPEGEMTLGPKVCVYVHWDGGGDVRDHVLHHVRSLVEAGLSIVFVTNSGFRHGRVTGRVRWRAGPQQRRV